MESARTLRGIPRIARARYPIQIRILYPTKRTVVIRASRSEFVLCGLFLRKTWADAH